MDHHYNIARDTFRFWTVPWLDDGTRILSTTRFQEFSDIMRGLRENWEKEVRIFLDKYRGYQEQAKGELGDLYDVNDYPTKTEMAKKFELKLHIMNMPDVEDFRANVSAEQEQIIRANIEETLKEATALAQRDAYSRIGEVVGKMSTKLANYKPDAPKGEQGTFRDSLVENVRHLVAVLPTLNVTDDAHIAALTTRMERDLCRVEGSELREDVQSCAEVQAAAAAIMADVSVYLA
jgi:hypothetical protein